MSSETSDAPTARVKKSKVRRSSEKASDGEKKASRDGEKKAPRDDEKKAPRDGEKKARSSKSKSSKSSESSKRARSADVVSAEFEAFCKAASETAFLTLVESDSARGVFS